MTHKSCHSISSGFSRRGFKEIWNLAGPQLSTKCQSACKMQWNCRGVEDQPRYREARWTSLEETAAANIRLGSQSGLNQDLNLMQSSRRSRAAVRDGWQGSDGNGCSYELSGKTCCGRVGPSNVYVCGHKNTRNNAIFLMISLSCCFVYFVVQGAGGNLTAIAALPWR